MAPYERGPSMLKFAKFTTVFSFVIVASAVLSALAHQSQLGSPGYTKSPLILVEVVAVLGALLWLLPQFVALIMLIVKREEAGPWVIVGAFGLLALLVGGYGTCVIDAETVLFAT